MKTNTPFLPGVSTQLYGKAKRGQLEAIQFERQRLRSQSSHGLAALFDDLLPIEWVKTHKGSKRIKGDPNGTNDKPIKTHKGSKPIKGQTLYDKNH